MRVLVASPFFILCGIFIGHAGAEYGFISFLSKIGYFILTAVLPGMIIALWFSVVLHYYNDFLGKRNKIEETLGEMEASNVRGLLDTINNKDKKVQDVAEFLIWRARLGLDHRRFRANLVANGFESSEGDFKEMQTMIHELGNCNTHLEFLRRKIVLGDKINEVRLTNDDRINLLCLRPARITKKCWNKVYH